MTAQDQMNVHLDETLEPKLDMLLARKVKPNAMQQSSWTVVTKEAKQKEQSSKFEFLSQKYKSKMMQQYKKRMDPRIVENKSVDKKFTRFC